MNKDFFFMDQKSAIIATSCFTVNAEKALILYDGLNARKVDHEQ